MGLVSKKVFSKKKVPLGFKQYDPARTKKQAFELARTYPNDMPSIVVKTGKKGDVFPYTVYILERYGKKNATILWRKILRKKKK